MSVNETPRQVILGGYIITAKIADGGMATLYLGCPTDGSASSELVALKVIKEGLASDEAHVHMFLDEAGILSRLSHPNVVQTREFGFTSGGHGYIAMELLRGHTLAEAWDAHASEGDRMPLPLGAWICARVAEGLHAAHALRDEEGGLLQVIHRDVNPTNVFLTYEGQVKLIDFGLARARHRRARTGDGIVKGKIPYLAPEQAAQGPIDRRIDVFALGATLWEVVTGRRLFKRSTDAETLQAVWDANIPDVRELVPRLPERLALIVRRAVAVAPDDRYGTAAELRRDLDAFLASRGEFPDKETLASYLEDRFPGQRAWQDAWIARASAT